MNISDLSDQELALLLHDLSGTQSQSAHDLKRENIPKQVHHVVHNHATSLTDQALSELRRRRKELKTSEALSAYIKDAVEKHDELREITQKEIWKLGTIVVPSTYKGEGPCDHMAEVVSCLSSTSYDQDNHRVALLRFIFERTISPFPLHRVHHVKKWRGISSHFATCSPEERGLLRLEDRVYSRGENPNRHWYAQANAGDVFYHDGLDLDLEFFESYYKGKEGVAIMRAHQKPLFVEVSTYEGMQMKPSDQRPIFFTQKSLPGISFSFPRPGLYTLD